VVVRAVLDVVRAAQAAADLAVAAVAIVLAAAALAAAVDLAAVAVSAAKPLSPLIRVSMAGHVPAILFLIFGMASQARRPSPFRSG
jgi:hypothetical protein